MNGSEIGKLAQPGGLLHQIEHSNGGSITFAGGVPLKNAKGLEVGCIGISGITLENIHALAEVSEGLGSEARAVIPPHGVISVASRLPNQESPRGICPHSL